jgi:hypothetical protein
VGKNIYKTVTVFAILMLLPYKITFANMLGDNPPLWTVATFGIVVISGLVFSYALLSLVNTVIEYFVSYLVLKKSYVNRNKVFGVYAIANFISYVPTVVVFLLTSTYLLVGIKKLDLHDFQPTLIDLAIPLLAAELTAVLIEVLVLSIGFHKLYKSKAINTPVSFKKTLLITISANLVSFTFSPLLWTFK